MRYAKLKRDITLYNARYVLRSIDDAMVVPLGTIVETISWDSKRVSVWVNTYNGLCERTDLEFLDEGS